MSVLKSIRLYISPYFLVRYNLSKDIAKIVEKNKFKGSLLDVGCGEKPLKGLFKHTDKYMGIDFEGYSINKDFKGERPDVFFDKKYKKDYSLSFKDKSFDNAISIQVIEHHVEPEKMISEMVRVVKPGGLILIAGPFICGLHEEPNDFQRITKYGIINLFKKNKCRVVEFKKQGSLFSTISMLCNEYLNNFAAKSKLHYAMGIVIYPPFFIFQYASLLLDKIFKSDIIYFNYVLVAKKQ